MHDAPSPPDDPPVNEPGSDPGSDAGGRSSGEPGSEPGSGSRGGPANGELALALDRLARLHERLLLYDDEYEAAKARLRRP